MSAMRIASGVVSRGEAVHRSGSPFTTELESSRHNNPFQNTVLQQSHGRDDAVVFSDLGGQGRTSARGDSLLLSSPAAIRQPTAAGDTPASASSSADTSSVPASSADPNIQQYIYFVASLSAEAAERRGEDFTTSFRSKTDELNQAVAESGQMTEGSRIDSKASASTAVAAQASVSNGEFSLSAVAAIHAEASLDAEFVGPDGTHVRIQASVQIDAAASVSVQGGQTQKCDPLVLDVDGDGKFALSDVNNGLSFDINADGNKDQTAFVQGADAFLALDRNGNGIIDDGSELFGDQHGAANGFAELNKFDSDRNGIIDGRDFAYRSLLGVQRQADGQLVTRSLSDLHVDSISLDSQNTAQNISGGNFLTQTSHYSSGHENHAAGDVVLNFRTLA